MNLVTIGSEMDAFIAAVEDARRRLSVEEGDVVSMREVIRRAGYTDSERSGIFHHLKRNKTWPRGHKVPATLIDRLTGPRQDGQPGKVLPISHEELTRAAQVAAGYNIEVSGPDLPTAYARLLGDENVTDEEKRAVTARLLQIIADEAVRKPSEVM